MAASVVVGPVVVALVSIVATLALAGWPRVQRAVSVAGGLGYAAAIALLAWRVVLRPGAPGIEAYTVAGWNPPFGITLVADGLSAFMLSIAGILAVASLVFAVRFIDRENQRVFYHPLTHSLLLGVAGAFLAGDLFNLFVWFEVLLLSSYVFVAFYGNAQQTAAAFRYLVLNVVASVFFLLALGGLYATVGTLNMADVARRLADPVAYGVDPAPVLGLGALLLAVFALKAGLVPFQFWVPGAYVAAPLPIVALFAGVTKKVGMYAIIRVGFTVFGDATVTVPLGGVGAVSLTALLAPVLGVMAVASMLVGGVGALSRPSIEEVLAYSSIGQVGFIALPVAIAAAAPSPAIARLGILAAVVYALHHALAKGLLFMGAATVRDATGTNRLSQLGGMGSRSTPFAAAFLVGSLSLVGIPPLTGFFGKFLVFEAAAGSLLTGSALPGTLALLALLGGAVLTIAYTTRVWGQAFWGSASERVIGAEIDGSQVAVLVALAGLIVLIGVGFDPVYRFAEAAAEAALDVAGYVEAVDPQGGAP
jgi:multicomponent Na+:H+ antiporter subunit D